VSNQSLLTKRAAIPLLKITQPAKAFEKPIRDTDCHCHNLLTRSRHGNQMPSKECKNASKSVKTVPVRFRI